MIKTGLALVALLFLSWRATAWSITMVVEGISFPIGQNKQIELNFGDSKSIAAMDEFGRQCKLSSGELFPFLRDGETLWRLEGATEDSAPFCRNGFNFKIVEGRFTRVDHDFENIFKYYATQACSAQIESGQIRPLSDVEAQRIHDCFLKRKPVPIKDVYKSYLAGAKPSPPLSDACTRELLKPQNITIICPSSFKKLGDESVFRDVVVIKEGLHQIRGAGSNANNYILHPDFEGEIDLRGHSRVFHLPHQKCHSPDVFRGCVSVAGFPKL